MLHHNPHSEIHDYKIEVAPFCVGEHGARTFDNSIAVVVDIGHDIQTYLLLHSQLDDVVIYFSVII